uniref:Uncharacterized protein n=1 Tax=viral metagenome TaxID=1070528 RepID=A0A6H1ZHL5_9ZZZZ
MMWSLEIERVDNGYLLTASDQEGDGPSMRVIEDGDEGGFVNLTSGENLLWAVMDFFNFGGSKHDKQRIRIVREAGDDYDS